MKDNLKIFLFMILFLTSGSSIFAKSPKVPTEKDMVAYLMAYFKDDTHSLYFALSNDGYTSTDINNGQPVIAGDTIAEQKGIRDPYIMRGADGWFYLAMTDLNIFAKQKVKPNGNATERNTVGVITKVLY